MDLRDGTLHGRSLENEFCDCARAFDGDVAGRANGSALLAKGPAARNGSCPAWSLAPKVFDNQGRQILAYAAETMHDIMLAATDHFMRNAAFRARFELPPQLERLALCAPQGVPRLPVVRVDVFLNEETGDFQFCETNTDGSAGFTSVDEVSAAVCASPSFAAFLAHHPSARPLALRDALMDAVTRIYGNWVSARSNPNHPNADAAPTLAIVDYLESLEVGEAHDFVQRFSASGFSARLADVRTLRLAIVDGEQRLCDDAGPIDCVWKRLVSGEVMRKPTRGIESLSQAARMNLACIIGGFDTWPTATKTLFALLHEPSAADYLTPGQMAFVRDHVPETHVLDARAGFAAFQDRELWIAKPAGGYNAQGVVAGADVSSAEWETVLMRLADEGGVVQRYAPQYATPAIPCPLGPDDDPLVFPMANNLLGLFVIDGRFAGVFPRCGSNRVIGEFQGRLEQGCLFVNE